MEDFLRYKFEGLIFGAAYTWRGLFSEFYGTYTYKLNTLLVSLCSKKIIKKSSQTLLYGCLLYTDTRGYVTGIKIYSMVQNL